MAKKGTRVVVTLECTEARTSSEPRNLMVFPDIQLKKTKEILLKD